jgi:two-component system, OmpR family, sensor histidine kinase BaeS
MRLPRRLRSLRARLLLATVAIAVAAVSATAWLTSRSTESSVRGDFERSLQVDGSIYNTLASYAATHRDWSDVEDEVRELADRTDRRIALTTRRGEPIVDSARLDGGGGAPLPDRPMAMVDPANPLLMYDEFMSGSIGSGLDEVDTIIEPEPTYVLTDDEMAERLALARAGSACMDAAGVRNDVRVHDGDAPEIVYDDADDAAAAVYDRCVDERRLFAPGAAEAADIEASAQELARCLDRRAVRFSTATDEYGTPMIEVDEADSEASVAYADCEIAVMARRTADPALLFLGSGERAGLARLTAGGGRTLAAAGAVALLAVAVTVLVSRRMLRPVAALTTAARRMEAGDLAPRVDVRGDDELAGLARSFNAMADAVATNEEQRRRLVNDVAHELRTPLANIRGYVEAAQDGVTPTDDRLLASLHEDAVLLQRLVDDLQTLALAEAGTLTLHRSAVDLAAVARQVTVAHALKAELADVGLDLVVDSGPDGDGSDGDGNLTVDADPDRLRQALGNLVTNAVRYSSAGDRVTVRVRRDGPDAVAEVADTGPGIAPDDLPHVFDRFWRADSSRARETGGSGLGLAISSQLIEAHGGAVTAFSELGEGSVFTIRLPAGSGRVNGTGRGPRT